MRKKYGVGEGSGAGKGGEQGLTAQLEFQR